MKRRGKDLWVLGLSASHNGAACLLKGDSIVCAIQEERLSRRKRHRIYGSTPAECIAYCLSRAGIQSGDLSLIVLCTQGSLEHPKNNISRNSLLKSSLASVPVLTLSHHLAHAVASFATCGKSEAAVLVVDGVGSPVRDLSKAECAAVVDEGTDLWESISLYVASGTELTAIEKHCVPRGTWLSRLNCGMPRFGSLGGMYSAVAEQIFGDYLDAGKVMGLAPYGCGRFLPESFYQYDGIRFHFIPDVPQCFRSELRWPQNRHTYEDLARSVQTALEEALLLLTRKLYSISQKSTLCYAGGVALNGIANERLIQESGFDELYIFPAAEDSGAAVGAAFYGLWAMTGENTCVRINHDSFGRPYGSSEIRAAIVSPRTVEFPTSDPIGRLAELLADGKVLGWFSGGSELGPRSLGHRSIVCDPTRQDLKPVLNRTIKRREAFRPFAPSVLASEGNSWFDFGKGPTDSPFMLRVVPIKPNQFTKVPAITHVDRTARPQTVVMETQPRWAGLIDKFRRMKGIPMILNTSFNGCSEPLVETPAHAIDCMLRLGLDGCLLEDHLVLNRTKK